MIENFNVSLEVTKNSQDEVEVNGLTRRAMMNNNNLKLEYYELICKPREIIDINQVEVDYKKIDRIIKDILRCNICLQIYNEPMNIKNCLHKFCKKCIEDYNRRIKKECALCRHPIETRRLMREDQNIKEIIKCLIPNIEKFNDVEEKILTNFLPTFFFKDAVHEQQQKKNTERIEQESLQNYLTQPTQSAINNISDQRGQNELLQRKKSRSSKTKKNETNLQEINDTSESNQSSKNTKETVGVKLICDTPKEDFKKYFSKTKLYTNEDISIDYLSKYICFKQNFPVQVKEKISFYILDQEKTKIFVDKTYSLKQIKQMHNLPDGDYNFYFTIDN